VLNLVLSHEDVWGEWINRSTLFTSALVLGDLHAPAALPQRKAPGTYCIEGCVWAQETVWTIQRSENSWPYLVSNSDYSVLHPVASRCTYCASPVLSQHLPGVTEEMHGSVNEDSWSLGQIFEVTDFKTTNTKLRGLSLSASYTDRATTTCRRS
jgi:hypothetical protein